MVDMVQIVKQAAEAQKLAEELERLRCEVRTYREIAELFATTIGLELGERALRSEMRRRCRNEYSAKRKLRKELRQLWDQYKAGTISREEFVKKEDEILNKIRYLDEVIYERTKDLREQASKVRELNKKIKETAPDLLRSVGIEVKTITDVSEVPEWIRKLVEAPTISVNPNDSSNS